MIIVKLSGGLGNQMFQYAAARRLSVINSAQLKLDLGWFRNIPNGDTQRRFELQPFNCQQEVASDDEVRALRGIDVSRWPKLIKALLSRSGGYKISYVQEQAFHFEPRILELRGDAYLDGYWQSEKYFADISATIRKEFSTNTPPENCNERIADMIRNSHSVSLHIRRGDYVSSKSVSLQHGNIPMTFYRDAMAHMKEQLGNPHYFVFSDDPGWARYNLNSSDATTYVNHNGTEAAYRDMELMKFCRHHIIANSSFSWWGAWLSENPSKIVIAPLRWFNRRDKNTDDLIPEGWLQL